jgi:hypothetical protein
MVKLEGISISYTESIGAQERTVAPPTGTIFI